MLALLQLLEERDVTISVLESACHCRGCESMVVAQCRGLSAAPSKEDDAGVVNDKHGDGDGDTDEEDNTGLMMMMMRMMMLIMTMIDLRIRMKR